MIPPLESIRKILTGNVELNGKKIPIIQKNVPYDKTPCITVDDSGGSRFLQRHITKEYYPLKSNHPQYDYDNPFLKHPQQVLREKYDTTISINIWADTGKDLENLNNQVMDLFYKAQTDHYLFCDNYQDGNCAYMDNTCYAQHFLNNRSVKGQCPKPQIYGYKNIFTRYNLIRASFHVDQPFTLNDTSKDQMVHRSVIRLHTGYYTDYIIGGLTHTHIKGDVILQ